MNLELVIQSEVSQKERQILYINAYIWTLGGFPCSSAGKESACNAGDLGLVPGLGRSPRGGNGNPLHCSWPGESP